MKEDNSDSKQILESLHKFVLRYNNCAVEMAEGEKYSTAVYILKN
jgi:hypothetical protein